MSHLYFLCNLLLLCLIPVRDIIRGIEENILYITPIKSQCYRGSVSLTLNFTSGFSCVALFLLLIK